MNKDRSCGPEATAWSTLAPTPLGASNPAMKSAAMMGAPAGALPPTPELTANVPPPPGPRSAGPAAAPTAQRPRSQAPLRPPEPGPSRRPRAGAAPPTAAVPGRPAAGGPGTGPDGPPDSNAEAPLGPHFASQ